MENGQIKSNFVISGAGVVNTYTKLIRENNKLTHSLDKKMDKVKQTGSYVCLHIGLNKSIQEMMIKTNLWIYPGYDHDQSLKNI